MSIFAPSKRNDLKVIQPEKTLTGGSITPYPKGLPKTTISLCPECDEINKIPARIFEENGRVMMAKSCPTHGDFKDCLSSDVALYLKMEDWQFGDMPGIANPSNEKADANQCPEDCGMCSLHTSNTALANVDLTNR